MKCWACYCWWPQIPFHEYLHWPCSYKSEIYPRFWTCIAVPSWSINSESVPLKSLIRVWVSLAILTGLYTGDPSHLDNTVDRSFANRPSFQIWSSCRLSSLSGWRRRWAQRGLLIFGEWRLFAEEKKGWPLKGGAWTYPTNSLFGLAYLDGERIWVSWRLYAKEDKKPIEFRM